MIFGCSFLDVEYYFFPLSFTTLLLFSFSYCVCTLISQAEKRLRTHLRSRMELKRIISLQPQLNELEDGHLPFVCLQYSGSDGVQHLLPAVYVGKVDHLNAEKLKNLVSFVSCFYQEQ